MGGVHIYKVKASGTLLLSTELGPTPFPPTITRLQVVDRLVTK